MSDIQTRTQWDRWQCEKCGEVRSSQHEENMCARVAELKKKLENTTLLYEISKDILQKIRGIVTTEPHADILAEIERLKKRNASLLEIAKECQAQCGEDYFWEQSGLSKRINESEG